ncbi:hypothetical protein FNYG_07239 [Fusarium nygamai]|uniref:Uncharacterized protein n=1 Tax=Gibberella nygamai TaxID=42673 RepID=A0A2K0WAU1_GIBNY|nr:hypothetical protein FNYG_07239 [Fusarium nygamai]
MYHIIFPDHSPPSSPYHSDTEDMAQFLHRSAGPIFRQDLRARLETVLADSFGDSFPRIVDDIVHQAMASLTSALLNNRDIDGKDTETSKSPLPAGTFDNGFSARTGVANCFDDVSSNAKPPNELESLPQSVNDAGDSSHKYPETCPFSDQGPDFGLWNSAFEEISDTWDHIESMNFKL